MIAGRALQLTDPGCCGIRRVDEDGCCVICGRDFYDPETGAEVGDGTRIPNECVRNASLDMLKALEAWLAWDGEIRESPSPPMMARAAVAKARGET